ncbi:hypothetical protein RHGRI_038706 [Rhododendron griersonianum]|uniref:Uncharacterized protein n=1 Tax=Rhododendron griersonianum TaxID=479676 RepID=A0AAV6HLF4_9ERIC|nr:hypothetical protein RHGRI_038706 [Rhododendron griersonianum]
MKRIKPRDLNPEILNLIIDGVRSDDVRSNLKMAATVSNQKILNDDETVDGGLMDPCRRGENADSEISSDVSSDERFINKYVPPPRAFANSEENQDEGGKDRKPDYFHVSTPRGQAADSHSLAERERSLKQCLSIELAAVNPSPDFNIDSFFAKEVFPASTSMEFDAPDNGEQFSEECLTKSVPEKDDEIVEGGERVKVYSGLLQAKPDEESADLGMEIEEGKGEKNLEEGMLEITKELCQEAEEEENQEFEVEEGNQEFTDPEKLETQDALLIQEREEEAKVEDRRERADDFMRTLGRCEKLNSEISLIQQKGKGLLGFNETRTSGDIGGVGNGPGK